MSTLREIAQLLGYGLMLCLAVLALCVVVTVVHAYVAEGRLLRSFLAVGAR